MNFKVQVWCAKLKAMKIKIIKDTNKIMRQKSLPISTPISKEDKDLLDSMLDYLKKSQDEEYARKKGIRAGVGLAAVQVGILKRAFVVYYHKDENTVVQYQLINPKIIENSIRKCALEHGEGCLSVNKEHKGLVHRYYKITMKAFDVLTNKDVEIKAFGYDAIVLQHEYDHLDGLFFYDRIDKKNPDVPLSGEQII